MVYLLKGYIQITAEAKEESKVSVEEISNKIIMPWLELSVDYDEIMEDSMTLIYNILNKFLLYKGRLTVFNELGEKLLANL